MVSTRCPRSPPRLGFVYVHPLQDGNGRMHRRLIHHVLAERKFTPPGTVFPVSSVMLDRIDDYRTTPQSHSGPLTPYIEWRATPVARDTGEATVTGTVTSTSTTTESFTGSYTGSLRPSQNRVHDHSRAVRTRARRFTAAGISVAFVLPKPRIRPCRTSLPR
jgi:hypothetical protein